MRIEELQAGEVETFVEELWVPAQHEMATAKRYTLKDQIREPGLAFNRSTIEKEQAVIYLAYTDEEPIGYVSAEIQTPPPMVEQIQECHIIELFVEEGSRRQGVAAELLDEAESWAQAESCEYTKLTVSSDNHAAIDLYESAGYDVANHSMNKRIEDTG
jgi:ribosomal protein S18 acetylase RimI-like enzyme